MIEPPSVDGVTPSERPEGTRTPEPGDETGATPAAPEGAGSPAAGASRPAAATMVPACGPMCPPPAGNKVPVRARTPTTTAASSEAVTSTGMQRSGPAAPPASAPASTAQAAEQRCRRPGRPWNRAACQPPRPAGTLRPDGGEHRQQVARGGPVARSLVQAARHYGPQLGTYVIELGRAVHQPVHQCRARPGTERPVPSSREGQHRAQAEDVTGRPDVIGQDLLRRQETGVHAGYIGGVPGPEPGQPRSVRGQHHVRGPEVTVHQVHGVHVAKAFGQPGGQPQHGRNRQRPLLADRLGQRWSRDVRRGQPRRRGVQIRVDHRCGERGTDLAGRRDLSPESGIGGQLGRDRPHHDRLARPAARPGKRRRPPAA